MRRTLRLLLLALLAPLVLALAACGGDEPAEDDGGLLSTLKQANQVRKSASAMQEKLEEMEAEGTLEPADPVDFRRLRELLPESVAGLDRGEVSGSKDGAMGYTVSQASADYADGADASATLKVQDMGGVQLAMMMGLAWTMAEIDRESGTKIERTLEFDGNPAYLEYDSEGGRGTLQVLVADRFVVAAEGRGLDADQLEDLVESVGLDQLDDWRDEGRGEAAVAS